MNVGDIMRSEVVVVSATDTFAHAASVMREARISSVVVKDGPHAAGIVTERDFVNVVADGLDPKETRIGDRMTRALATVEPRTDVADAARLMGDRGIRHLPVVRGEDLVGIISIRDLMAWAVEELTGGHELADIPRGSATLTAAVQVEHHA